jgi:hypothetical protein
MALNKKYVDDKGVETNYHKVSHVTVADGNLSCLVDSYVSKDYREIQKPAFRLFFNFNIELQEEESYGIRQLCYMKIKEQPEWSDATDC